MLAGLLFAAHDAEDRPASLAATLPFAGVTLIEYQARLLIQAGASQVIVLVTRLTPELLGALARIGKRGVTVDAVRSAAEASAKLHPLARLLVLADGLVTTENVIAPLAREGGDTLLVVEETEASGKFERVGGRAAWAGVARIEPQRLAEVAMLPNDYDSQSALIRVALQARAQHLLLSDSELRQGHGIERSAASLETRGHAVMAAIVSGRRGWFDRWVVAPIARAALKPAMRRATPTGVWAGGAAVLGAIGLGTIAFHHDAIGIVAALMASIALSLGTTLAWLRDEFVLARGQAIAGAILPAVTVLFFGRAADELGATNSAALVALGLVVAAALGQRAIAEHRRRRWWGSPGAYLLVLAPFALAGWPLFGLSLAALYASATLTDAIEKLRRQA